MQEPTHRQEGLDNQQLIQKPHSLTHQRFGQSMRVRSSAILAKHTIVTCEKEAGTRKIQYFWSSLHVISSRIKRKHSHVLGTTIQPLGVLKGLDIFMFCRTLMQKNPKCSLALYIYTCFALLRLCCLETLLSQASGKGSRICCLKRRAKARKAG